MDIKTMMIVMMMVGNNAVSTERIDFDNQLDCTVTANALWDKYKAYLKWAADPDNIPAPQSAFIEPTTGVTPPSIPIPLIYCVPHP